MTEVSRTPNTIPDYVQTALDSTKADLLFLRQSMDSGWRESSDLAERIDNWLFNTERHLDDILA